MSTDVKMDIRAIEPSAIEAWFKDRGQPAYRARQVIEWMWQKGCHNFEEMTNISRELRKELQASFEFRPIQLDKTQFSTDGTIKYRFKLYDDNLIESVLIPVPEENRYTVCVSSQVGCSLSCSFCATGKMKRLRNLDAAEIYDQVFKVNFDAQVHFDHPLTNIVYMGMGEPLLAYRNVLQSIHYITSEKGLGMSPRRITVSTAGIAKMIKKLADDRVRFNLALSLHAATDEKRNTIMPINTQNNLSVLMDALEYFHKHTKNKISYEYIAFDGFNDTADDARALAKLCKRFPVQINIIEYNPVQGVHFNKSDKDQIDIFAQILRSHNVMVTVRRSRGKDIDAACGQLANKE